jgi:hypothetical protein
MAPKPLVNAMIGGFSLPGTARYGLCGSDVNVIAVTPGYSRR